MQELLGRLESVRRSGEGWIARCPAHDDRLPSLSIGQGEKGVVLKCHAGCEPIEIVQALGLELKDLFVEPASNESQAVYDYVDGKGVLAFQVVRLPGKRFRQRRPDGNGGFVWNLNGVERLPYRLPLLLLAAKEGHEVWVVEGEKDVHALEQAGVIATTNPGGAGKWRSEYAEFLRGTSVTIVADKDDVGHKHAVDVARSLNQVAASVRIVEAKTGHDAAEHLAAGFNLEEFVSVEPDRTPSVGDQLAQEFVHGGAVPTFMPAANFVRLDFPKPEVYLGTDKHVVLYRGCLAMIYGDEGAGKTTALIDGVAHTAAELGWLGLSVTRALRWLLIENESAPGMFQRLLLEKRERWEQDAAWFDNVHVHGGEGLWGIFDFRQDTHRQALWNYCREHAIDLVAVSPTFGAGGPGSGKPDETQAFVDTMLRPAGLWQDTGFVLVHHENKAGQVSGDWGRQPDTVIQFERDGEQPRTRLTWHKLRYSSELGERKRKQLLDWVPEHKGFTVSDVDLSGAVSDEELHRRLGEFLSENPDANTTTVSRSVTGEDERLVQLLKEGTEQRRYRVRAGKHNAKLWSVDPGGLRAGETQGTQDSFFGGDNPHG